MPIKQVTILLVDDDDVDVLSIQRAMRRLQLTNPLIRAKDGIEALEILRGTPDRPPLDRPFLILLDLKMPRMNGQEFLNTIRKNKAFLDSIVFVLTTSANEQDVARAYEKNVAGYLLKGKFDQAFLEQLDLLSNYSRHVKFPPVRASHPW